MCRPVRCRKCNKTTWAGCGAHVAQVRARVPADQWCDGRHDPSEFAGGATGGFFARLRRRAAES